MFRIAYCSTLANNNLGLMWNGVCWRFLQTEVWNKQSNYIQFWKTYHPCLDTWTKPHNIQLKLCSMAEFVVICVITNVKVIFQKFPIWPWPSFCNLWNGFLNQSIPITVVIAATQIATVASSLTNCRKLQEERWMCLTLCVLCLHTALQV